MYFEAYAEPSVSEQAAPERPMDVPIVVPTLPVDATFPCCPGCEVLNETVTELVPIEEDHPVMVPRDNQGRGARMAAVRSGQHARRGGRSDHQGYGGICHRHGRLARLLLDSFFYFAKSNSSLTLVDLIFPLILSVHVILILSYPYIFTFILTHSLSFFQMR